MSEEPDFSINTSITLKYTRTAALKQCCPIIGSWQENYLTQASKLFLVPS